jgi:hypothetical protein
MTAGTFVGLALFSAEYARKRSTVATIRTVAILAMQLRQTQYNFGFQSSTSRLSKGRASYFDLKKSRRVDD